MEKRTFTIPENKREEITKLINRYQRKATEYGIPMTVEFGNPYMTEVAIKAVDHENNCVRKVGATNVEVFDLTIESEIIKKNGYSVAAKIEHLDGGNVVDLFGETEMKMAWTTLQPRCEHCGTNHRRKITYIVRHENGEEKQIGRTCLKDYCGIDPNRVGYVSEICDILEDEWDIERYDFVGKGYSPAYDVVEVIALAMTIIKKQGYVKSDEPNGNKWKMIDEIGKYLPTDEEKNKAKEIADGIAAMDNETAFKAGLNNVRSMVLSGYCTGKHFGYLAFAPIAYEKYIEKQNREREFAEKKQEEAAASNWVGEVGKRIEVVVSIKLLTSWETQYGMTYLYKMVDENGNVFIWYASKRFGKFDPDGAWEDFLQAKIKATIKDHTERDGVKQTVVTRCKVA